MFNSLFGNREDDIEEELERERKFLQSMSDRALMIEMLLELKRISDKCDKIGEKIVLWGN